MKPNPSPVRAAWRLAFSNYRRTSRGAYIMERGVEEADAWTCTLRALSSSWDLPVPGSVRVVETHRYGRRLDRPVVIGPYAAFRRVFP